MYDASHPKAGGDNYDRFGMGTDTAEPLTGGSGVGAGSFGTTEDWSSWPSNVPSVLDPNAVPEDTDNTAFGRIDIPV